MTTDTYDWDAFGGQMAEARGYFSQLAPPDPRPESANPAPPPDLAAWPEPVPLTEPMPPFPVDALPGDLGEFVSAVSESTQTPLELPAGLALAVLAAAAQKVVTLRVRRDYGESLSLSVSVVLQPSERKSVVEGQMAAPLRAHEARLQEDARPLVLESRRRLDILKMRRRRLVAELAKSDTPQPSLELMLVEVDREISAVEQVVMPRLLADDVTPQSLVALMAEQDGRIAVISSEGAPLEAMVHRGGRSGALDVFLKGYSGDPMSVDRKSGTRISIAAPALSVGVTVQPSVIRRLARDAAVRERGLLSRFLFFYPNPRAGRREVVVTPVSESVQRVYADTVGRLLRIPVVRQRGEIIAQSLALSDGAYDGFLQFAEAIEPRVGPGGDLELCGWGGKLPGQMLRIAALLHLVSNGMSQPVTPNAVDSAIRIATFLIPHAKAAFGLMAIDPRVEDALHIARMMHTKGISQISQRDLGELVKGRVKPLARFELAMGLLVRHGFMRREEENVAGKRGPKAVLWTLNPRVGPELFGQGDWA